MGNCFEIRIGDESACIETADELVAVLDVLQGHHDKEVLQQLSPDLHSIIRNSRELLKIVAVLPNEDQIFLFKILGDHLSGIIGNGAGLRDLLAYISASEVEEALIEMLKPEGIQKLIIHVVELAEVLEWVYGCRDRMIIDYLGADSFQNMVENGRDLSLVMRSLEPDFQKQLLNELGIDYLNRIIRQKDDFSSLLKALPFETSKKLMDSMSHEKLKGLVRSSADLAYISKFLDQKETDYLKLKLEGIEHASCTHFGLAQEP